MSYAPDSQTDGLSVGSLQRWFHGQVVAPSLRGEEPATRPLVEAASRHEAGELIRPSATLAPAERVAIYSDMYLLRIVDALAEDYRAVRAVLGAERFRAVAQRYVTRFPSRSYTLDHTGNDLPEYLAAAAWLDDAPLLADVARLERAVNQAFHAAPSEVLTPSLVAQVPVERWPELRFRMGAAVHVLALAHPANDVVSAVAQGGPVPPVERAPSWVAVWRKDFVVWRQSLSEPAYTVLSALAQGETMAVAVAAAQAVWSRPEAELEQRLFEWFADWLNEGLFAGLVLPADLDPT